VVPNSIIHKCRALAICVWNEDFAELIPELGVIVSTNEREAGKGKDIARMFNMLFSWVGYSQYGELPS
jgi:hypothetical protein